MYFLENIIESVRRYALSVITILAVKTSGFQLMVFVSVVGEEAFKMQLV